ncbi:transglycosylase domain-containing protein [Symbioplanes lichenis]|uniref:transglycosylase domain-containing protein n=1 Tax=Symbioplanes lichenis TaxID=1629072 RepID=UPI00273A0603|nr:transglycosylase domain-containing protein [Actinoplanes lichenis]
MGAASVSPGRASVSPGRASVGAAAVGGRASVGAAAPVANGGRASVARAAVRPVSPAVGGGGLPDPHDGNGRKGSAAKILNKAAKKRRRTNIITAAAAVLVILLGAGTVAGTYFFDDVVLPTPKTEDQSNVILYSGGAEFARLGDQNRTVVPEAKINKVVEHAVAAAEDKNYYDHNGIDMKGIARAAWNNFTGGSQQGASTITQQYARHAADLKEISYNRKLREAVIARKLDSTYSKDQVMGFYLNYIYLGDGYNGIEAAAKGYFGKSVLTPAGEKNAVTPYEAAVLASIIKQPEPTPGGHKGYNPRINLPDAKDRWEYTMKNMVEMGWITQDVYNARKYPTVKPASSNTCKTCKTGSASGIILRHVKAELAEMGISESEFAKGGLQITTTINQKVQAAAEKAGSRKSKASPMSDLPKTYQAAVIGIDPKTGRVLGYYGGDNPEGTDYGSYLNGTGTGLSGAGQSPGSTFKIYTLAAGLREGISFDTRWDGKLPNKRGERISNAGAEDSAVCNGGGGIERCSLEEATIQSYNFPFYWIADGIGVSKVVQAAKDAGLKHLVNNDGKIIDLEKTDASTWDKNFSEEVAFGQFRVLPLEHAEGVATIVNQGERHEAHFIKSVKKMDENTGKFVNFKSELGKDGKQVFDKAQMSDLEGVMAKIPEHAKNTLEDGREAIAKSGTWEYQDPKGRKSKNGSGDTWFVGGIPQLAATVWVGGATNRLALKEKGGEKDMFGSGTPAQIWEDFIESVTEALDMKKEDFPERERTGNPDSEYANGKAAPPPPPPAPENTQVDPNCQLFQQCDNNQNQNQDQNQGNQGDQNNGDQGNNDNGNNDDQNNDDGDDGDDGNEGNTGFPFNGTGTTPDGG